MPEANSDGKTALLEARDLTKVYADGAVRALDGVSLQIDAGQYIAIMGPSGSGKSTLLHMLGALDEPTSGDVLFQGEKLSDLDSLDQIRSTKVGFVFQSFYLLPNLTAVENVQLPMFESDRDAAKRRQRAVELLETVGMAHRTAHLPTRLSVGERQRVAIARALANEPLVLLADEPTGNLDSQTGKEILQLFDQLHQQLGTTIVMVTHAAEVAQRADRIINMRDGKVCP